MKAIIAKNSLGNVQSRVQNPSTQKSVIELAREIPKGKYAELSLILEAHEIPKRKTKHI
jgi:hypothetical protein